MVPKFVRYLNSLKIAVKSIFRVGQGEGVRKIKSSNNKVTFSLEISILKVWNKRHKYILLL